MSTGKTNEPLLCCDECFDEPVPYTELVTIQGASLCRDCAFKAAAEAVAPLLSPTWSATPGALRNAEEGVQVLEQLLATAKARIRVERTKAPAASVNMVELARSVLFAGGR